jgi:cadmium resistance protein CadD (predicted permease)
MIGHGFIPVLAASCGAFIGTNADDLITLLVFLAQVDGKTSTYLRVFLGQFLGFTILNLVCLIGIALGNFIPGDYLGLLGFLPLINGLWKIGRQFVKIYRNNKNASEDQIIKEEIEEVKLIVEQDEAEVILGSDQTETMIEDYQSCEHNSTEIVENQKSTSFRKRLLKSCVRNARNCLSPSSIEVALVVIADGGDTLTSFLPLFANEYPEEILLTVIIVYAATLIMYLLAYFVLQFRYVARMLHKYGNWIRPLMLIGLGIYILSDSILASIIRGHGSIPHDDDDDD